MNCMYYILALLIVSCFSTINHTNQESPEYVSEQCVLNYPIDSNFVFESEALFCEG